MGQVNSIRTARRPTANDRAGTPIEKLLAEDEPILNTMRFKQGVMVASDRHLSRYFKYVSEFPNAGRLAPDSPERWRAARAGLKRRRHLLTQAAGRLYPDAARVGTTTLLCRPEWIPAQPLALEQVGLAWTDTAPPGADTGGAASAHLRPRRRPGPTRSSRSPSGPVARSTPASPRTSAR